MLKLIANVKKVFPYLAEYFLFFITCYLANASNTTYESYVLNDTIIDSVFYKMEPQYLNRTSLIKNFHLNESNYINEWLQDFQTKESSNNRGPPSFSILMNFQNDGTTSVQIFANNIIYWNDKGLCAHGQMFDPNINQCRDVFCMEGFIFSAEGCKVDPNFNKTSGFNTNNSIPEDLELELTLLNKLCNSIEIDQDNCTTIFLMDSEEKLIEEFRSRLGKDLNITSARIQNITILFNDTINYNSTYNSTFEYTEEDNESEIIENIIINNSIERVRLKFIIRDHKMYPEDNEETLMLYYTLFRLSLEYFKFRLFEKDIIILNVTEVKASKRWCVAPDQNMVVQGLFSLLASFDNEGKPKYHVYVNETDTLYGTGDFFLTIGVANRQIPNSKQNSLILNTNSIPNNNRNFQDLTDAIFDSNNGVVVQKLLTVCNRKPKISPACSDHTTIKLNICELTAHKNRTLCYINKFINKCYSINEYEYDNEEEDHIHVCKFEDQNGIYLNEESKISSSIQGYVSFVSTSLSLTAMIVTLLTFALFNELRNIPGWNCINLTIALFIAQFSFLIGSLAVPVPTICLITALSTHYGFLAAFFNMNVIAFDLYRNFRTKSSHILINSINLKSRLLKYAAYSWLTPLLLVILCLIIDITVKSKTFNFKPCYASYFQDCSTTTIDIFMKLKQVQLNSSCVANGLSQPTMPTHYVQHCYIQNGNANLLFFGAPVGIIILVNAVFYILTVCNISQKRRKQKHIRVRRMSKVKSSSDNDIKFYIRMAVIMGFTWIIGFFLTTFSSESDEFKIINQILIYVFILSNSSMGVFIFFAFIFKREIKDLYVSLFKGKFSSQNSEKSDGIFISFLNFLKNKISSMKRIMCYLCRSTRSKS